MLEKLKKYCDSFLELGLPGFDLMVCRNGECILRYMNGYADLENKIKMKGDERYFIYSASKPITCTAALMLYEEGAFSLEDELSHYMPEFAKMTVKAEDGSLRPAKNPILIKHLFEMTAGFSYVISSPELLRAKAETDGRCPTREVMRYLAKEPLLFEPGERWQYSLCHDVLAALVEAISGEKFEAFVKSRIFDPLGMTNSTFLPTEADKESLAQQYSFDKEQKSAYNVGKINPYLLGTEHASGGAGCISTVTDYMKFLEALRTYKLLSPETLTLMTTDRLNDQQRQTYTSGEKHGYGLGVRTPKKDGKLADFGWGGAAAAYLAIDMKNGLSIYFGAHQRNCPAQGLRSKIYQITYAELLDNSQLDGIFAEASELLGYELTF